MTTSKQCHSISIIGAGKVGTTLTVLFHRAGYRIASVISREQKSAKKLANLVGCRSFSSSIIDIANSTQILIIATPEEAISDVVRQLVNHPSLNFRKIVVFHTSGVITSDVLLPLHYRGAIVFSLHPIQTFPKDLTLANQLQRIENIYYGFEGTNKAFQQASYLVKVLGGKIIRIPKEKKILYHIACVVASNYSVALLGMVEEVLALVGGDVRLKHFAPLIKSSIENAILLTPKKALTGPIARGSISTIECHLRELFKKDKHLALQYRQLGRQVLQWTSIQKMLTQETKQKLKKLLESK